MGLCPQGADFFLLCIFIAPLLTLGVAFVLGALLSYVEVRMRRLSAPIDSLIHLIFAGLDGPGRLLVHRRKCERNSKSIGSECSIYET